MSRFRVGRIVTIRKQLTRSPSRVPARVAGPPPERRMAAPAAAAQAVGILVYDRDPLVVVANTDTVHDLVVCPLCSCYPRAVLGLAPNW